MSRERTKELERTRLKEIGDRPVPVLIFPNGEEIEIIPGQVFEDAGHYRHELERWLDAWSAPLPPIVMPATADGEVAV